MSRAGRDEMAGGDGEYAQPDCHKHVVFVSFAQLVVDFAQDLAGPGIFF